MKWYLAALKKYAIFNGRSRRTEYWMFALFNVFIATVLYAGSVGTSPWPVSFVYALGVLVPTLSATVRRLHDTDRPAWWLLSALIPPVLVIILLLEGDKARNRFGPDPKRVGAEIV